jgi:hypothetical protein
MPEPTPEEIADGMALWQEMKPLTGEDWVWIAVSTLAAGDHPGNGSPIFEGLLLAVADRDSWRRVAERCESERQALREALRRIHDHPGGNDQRAAAASRISREALDATSGRIGGPDA